MPTTAVLMSALIASEPQQPQLVRRIQRPTWGSRRDHHRSTHGHRPGFACMGRDDQHERILWRTVASWLPTRTRLTWPAAARVGLILRVRSWMVLEIDTPGSGDYPANVHNQRIRPRLSSVCPRLLAGPGQSVDVSDTVGSYGTAVSQYLPIHLSNTAGVFSVDTVIDYNPAC